LFVRLRIFPTPTGHQVPLASLLGGFMTDHANFLTAEEVSERSESTAGTLRNWRAARPRTPPSKKTFSGFFPFAPHT
jgi:hypothetical protein